MSEKIKKFKRKLKNISAFDYALYLVSLRMYSRGNLIKKLKEKGYPDEEVLSAINRLTELKYLDDRQYAQIYLENLIKYRNFGYFGVKRKLLEKRLPKELVDKLMQNLTFEEEVKIGKRLLNSGALARASKENEKASKAAIARKLQSKGFRSETIFKLIGTKYLS